MEEVTLPPIQALICVFTLADEAWEMKKGANNVWKRWYNRNDKTIAQCCRIRNDDLDQELNSRHADLVQNLVTISRLAE